MSTNEEKPALDQLLDNLPADKKLEVTRHAVRYGFPETDPLFQAVRMVVDTETASKAAVEAAGAAATAATQAAAEAAKIPDQVYQGTIRAGADLRGQVAAAGIEIVKAATEEAAKVQDSLTAAVQGAAQAGASVLGKAVQGMDQAARDKIELLIARGIDSVGAAVRADARAAVAGRMARSWGAVAGLLLFFMLLGGVGAWGGLYLSHHLTPINMQIAVNQAGHRLCGTLRIGTQACLVHINP